MSVRFTTGDKAEAIGIMREAARWLTETGRPMWNEADLSEQRLTNPPEEFIVLWEGDKSAAAMTLSYQDDIFWPEIPPDTSGFIHKLSVRRAYAGKGFAKRLVEEGKRICAEKGIRFLRLDTDPGRAGLIVFYRDCGFSFLEIRTLETAQWGTIKVALYEMDCFSEAHIRPIAPEDLPEAAGMIRAAFATVAEAFGITKENGPRHTSFITAEKLQEHFGWGWMMFGLYEGERLVGYVSLSEEGGGVFELHNLAVRPECRHKGYGKRLLDLCKEKAVEQGGQKITLSHIEENTVIKNWYGANGFVHTGTRKFDFLPFTSGYMEWRP